MELKFDKETNVCEYLNPKNGTIVNVLSNEDGLYFNLNDIFKMFGAIKSSKLWFSKNISKDEQKWVEFDRDGRMGRELFIPEFKVHELINKIKGDVNDNVDFIYGIIADYDTTCINIKDVELNTEERIALYAIKSESQEFTERTEKYLDVLKGKTMLSDYFGNFEERLSYEIDQSKMKYDNHKCPEDIRQEELQAKLKNKPKVNAFVESIEGIGNQIHESISDIYDFIDQFETTDNGIVEGFEILYDDYTSDYNDQRNVIKRAKEVLDERDKRCEAIKQAVIEITTQQEKSNKNKKESTCPSWLKDVLK